VTLLMMIWEQSHLAGPIRGSVVGTLPIEEVYGGARALRH
jgi:hypothetical protein